MTKKILLVIDNLGSGGAQNQLTLLASGLKAEGHQISIFTYFPQDFFKQRLLESNITHFYKEKNDKVGFGVIKELIAIINKERFDAIISFLDTPNFYAALATRLAKHQPKLIISYRSKTEFDKLSWSALKIKEWTNKCADVIIANSNHERERWQEKYPHISHKWATIYNAVEDKLWDLKAKNIANQNRYLVVGSVSSDKNGLAIIQALHQLTQKGVNIAITWLGEKVYHIPDRLKYLKAMENEITALQLEDNWDWQNPTVNITDFYQSHKALILASKVEGMPNVVCEALSCGLPCIVSNVLDHPKLITPHKNGFLFDPDKPDSLAVSISELEALTVSEYQNMCMNALEFAKQNFKKSIFTQRFIRVL
jgi:glycosyltransferase involved in cell wall biosynthesis